ncbi:Rieske 2Fe-2S domain-containing protein [Leucobacter allii]
MTNAVAAALSVTSLLLGGRLDWAATLRRHGPSLRGAGDAVGANLAVAGRMLGGWAEAELSDPATAAALGDGEGRVIRDGVAPVGVARVDGAECRVSGVCPHLGGVLRWNPAERSWDCPLHGSRFTARGERLEGPAVTDLEPR